jgi:hypothetical protein
LKPNCTAKKGTFPNAPSAEVDIIPKIRTNKPKYKPDAKRGIKWGEYLGRDDCPYLRRWVINFGPFAFRLHHWISSDDLRYYHDHPWWFFTLVIKGSYVDLSPKKADRLTAGHMRFRPADHVHSVKVDPGGAWTLLLTGKNKWRWGFFPPEGFLGVRDYFRKYGHPPCED